MLDLFRITPPNRYHPYWAKAVLVRNNKVLVARVSVLDWLHKLDGHRIQQAMEDAVRKAAYDRPST